MGIKTEASCGIRNVIELKRMMQLPGFATINRSVDALIVKLKLFRPGKYRDAISFGHNSHYSLNRQAERHLFPGSV